jgi:hypothetical protein
MKNPLHDLFATMTGDGARGFEQFFSGWPNPADWAKGEMQGLLGLPAFGYNRESQGTSAEAGGRMVAVPGCHGRPTTA